jgi:hypothetical protein
MADDYDSADEEAGAVAQGVYASLLLRKAAVVLATMAGFLLLVVSDYTFALLALWNVPSWAKVLLTAFLVAELVFFAFSFNSYRRRRAARLKPLTAGDRITVAMDQARERRASTQATPWAGGVRSRRFWLWVVSSVVYTTCGVVMLTVWFGLAAGLAVGAAYAAVRLFISLWTRRALMNWDRLLLFSDVREPRDSPEV